MASSTTSSFFINLFTATIGPLLFGYHLGELNAPQAVIMKSFDPPITTIQFGLIQSIFTLGGLVGALSAGPVSSARGRVATMRINSLFQISGPIFEAFAHSVPIFALGRLLSGVGAGAALVAVPMYVSEIAPPAKRGFYGAFTQIMCNGGIFVTQLLGYFLSHGQMWRVILAVAGMIALVQLAALLTMASESPRWLIDHDSELARKVLRKLRGTTDVEAEIKSWDVRRTGHTQEDAESQSLLSNSSENSDFKTNHTFVSVVKAREYRPAILAIVLVMAAQQFTGINSIVMYGVGILSALLPTSSALLNVFIALLNVVLTTLFAPLVDIWGRKRCLLFSIAGMSTSALLLAVALKSHITMLSAVCVLTFVASFAIGLGPVPFMLASELVDAQAVSATQSWALGANWIATFIVAQFFPVVNEALGKGGAYFMFAGSGVLFLVSIRYLVPETMGKSGMQEVWKR